MARTKTFDRDQAVGLVMNEIWRNGYEANSVKAISEKLGITRSSFYNAFGSREALFSEVLQRYAEQSPDYELFSIKGDLQPLALITMVFRNAVTRRIQDSQARGCMVVNSIAELVGNHKNLGPLIEAHIELIIAKLCELCENAKENGQLQSDVVPEVLASSLLANLIGLNMLSKVVRSEDTLWELTKTNLMGLGVYCDNWEKVLTDVEKNSTKSNSCM